MPLQQMLPRWHQNTTHTSPQRKRISSGQVAVVLTAMSLIASIFFFIKSQQVSHKSYDVSVQAQRLSIRIDCHDRDDLKFMPICQEYLSTPPDTFLEEPDLARTVGEDKEKELVNKNNEPPLVGVKQRFYDEADRLLLFETGYDIETLYPTVIMLRMMGDHSALLRNNRSKADSAKVWGITFLVKHMNPVFEQSFARVIKESCM